LITNLKRRTQMWQYRTCSLRSFNQADSFTSPVFLEAIYLSKIYLEVDCFFRGRFIELA
jgi:hypothetical protein